MEINEHPFACTQCNYQFSTPSDLRHHVLTHKRERPPSNTKRNNDSNKPSTGLTWHKQDKSKNVVVKPVLDVKSPITCSKCENSCADDSSLHTHMLNGSCELIFKCTECDKEYPNESDLSKHQREHYIERPYVCKKCPQRFKSSADLNKHICDVPFDDCSFLSSQISEDVTQAFFAPTVPTGPTPSEASENTQKVNYIN